MGRFIKTDLKVASLFAGDLEQNSALLWAPIYSLRKGVVVTLTHTLPKLIVGNQILKQDTVMMATISSALDMCQIYSKPFSFSVCY